MSYVRSKIILTDCGITDICLRKAITGGLIIEVPGKDSEAKADQLYAAMSPLVAEKGARLTRPIKTVEVKIKGLDESISPEEIKNAVASAGSCRSTDVKVGRARVFSSGLSTAWMQCPVAAARKIVAAGALHVG
ncbi:uncharacterized protein LOC109862520 [Pseudomyrmex gracilis]|uniref:uncharacterized protein LOC109862520 n=1 Tax=Pseudomyrmex gracilis TaxID=219809 RepID=UPI000995D5F2|nr:uncharacterized protein LOC109862520 [Pseudomyrmex gracilis]